MKTVLLCLAMLIAGVVAGSIVTGYFTNSLNKRLIAHSAEGELTRDARQAKRLKLGEAATVLGTLENSIQESVKMLGENAAMREYTSGVGLAAAKEFYVCTDTAVPSEIAALLEPVPLRENACGTSDEHAETAE